MSFLSFFHLNPPLEAWRGATLDSPPVLFCPYHGLLLEGLLSSVYLKFYLVLDVGLWGGNSILVIFFSFTVSDLPETPMARFISVPQVQPI